MFICIYFAVLLAAFLLISIEGGDIISNFTAVIATLSNIGPGLGTVGPAGSFAAFSPFAKLVLSFCMIAGRLEFFPALILFTPAMWKRGLIK